MSIDLSTKPNFEELSGHDLVRYNNAMVREILGCGLTGYREVTCFQNKEAGVKRCEVNWSALKCGRDKVAAEAEEQAPKKAREPRVVTKTQVTTVTANLPLARVAVAGNKGETLKAMLTTGATVEEMTAAMGWQAHTLRARISTLSKDTGCSVQRTRKDGVTTYQIVA
jgi:hypothetical protein